MKGIVNRLLSTLTTEIPPLYINMDFDHEVRLLNDYALFSRYLQLKNNMYVQKSKLATLLFVNFNDARECTLWKLCAISKIGLRKTKSILNKKSNFSTNISNKLVLLS